MNRRLKDLFQGAKVVKVVEGIYIDTGNKYCEVRINGKKLPHKFNSFVNPRCKGGYTDFQRTKFIVSSDGFRDGNTVQVFGTKFDLEERISRKNEKYLALLKDGRKVGYFINEKQRACFNNVCL